MIIRSNLMGTRYYYRLHTSWPSCEQVTCKQRKKCNSRCTTLFGSRAKSQLHKNTIYNPRQIQTLTIMHSNPSRVVSIDIHVANESEKNNALAPTHIVINVLKIDLKLTKRFSASFGLKAALKHGCSIAKIMNELISILNKSSNQRIWWHSSRS